jgi:hypothetical protein
MSFKQERFTEWTIARDAARAENGQIQKKKKKKKPKKAGAYT